MKKILAAALILVVVFLFGIKSIAMAQSPVEFNVALTPIPCEPLNGRCHADLNRAYSENPYYSPQNHSCATSFDDFLSDPTKKHYWVEDPVVTKQGKADERARQFIYWTVTRSAIDDHPALKSVWGITRNIALFMTLIVAAVLGLGLIVGQRFQFDFKIQVWPAVFKILLAMLYITFSATIVILLIQLSEILMKFFNETLRGGDLFNIYFGGSNPEENYIRWVGCRDINIRAQEGADTEIMMLRLTNITYYIMGAMLLLRKIILWFMLFVSPLLAILMPFVFIRNTGWIWIGVFFQWLFYGPLFALFLGATAKIWNAGIPFLFDFNRANSPAGYVYPTAINILYGGPSQHPIIGLPMKNANYVDTFVEYVITLLMLWAVTFFPWWLLRIFRDYCCEGIMAMKNILLAMYDQSRSGPPPGGPLGPTPALARPIGTTINYPQKIDVSTTASMKEAQPVRLERIEEVRQAKTQDIMRSMQISVSKLSDVARFETQKDTQQTVNKSIEYLKNPMKAQTPTERQQYMNVKTELFNRAVKQDNVAKQVLSSVSTSRIEQVKNREEFTKAFAKQQSNFAVQQKTPLTHVISVKVKIPHQQVATVTQKYIDVISANTNAINNLAHTSQAKPQEVQKVLQSFSQNINTSPAEIVSNLEKQTGVEKERIVTILKNFDKYAKKNKEIAKKVAKDQQVTSDIVEKVLEENIPLATQPERQIESAITIPQTVSLEDYEEVKKMWVAQYEKGEVPVSENITDRGAWVDNDVVFITNTLNKLMSTDEKLKQEALDELGYILPVFMINNFSGEELLVYLKAKLEAARSVRDTLSREAEIKQQVEGQQEEEFVEIAQSNDQEQTKEMHLEAARSMPLENLSSKESISGQEVSPIEQSATTRTQIGAQDTHIPPPVIKHLTDIARVETSRNTQNVMQQILSRVSSADIERMHRVAEVFENARVTRATLPQALALQLKLPPEQIAILTSNLVGSLAASAQLIGSIAQTTGVPAQTVQSVLQALSKNIQMPSHALINQIVTEAGASTKETRAVLEEFYKTLQADDKTIKQEATKQGLKTEDAKRIVQKQAPLVTMPEKHIETSVPLPDSVSLEDYEEVKKMWVAQYEKGEVPVSENITDRDAWVDNDVVFITNTLNKLMSTDEKLKQEALDELGYILPVFMINNFSGEELLVYLKAKLEAAKEIQSKMSAVQSATQSRQASQEFVDVTSHKQPPVVYEEQTAQAIPQSQQSSAQQTTQQTNPPQQTSTIDKLRSIIKIETIHDAKHIEELSRQLTAKEQEQKKTDLQKTIPAPVSAVQAITTQTGIPQAQVNSITNAAVTTILKDTTFVSQIAKDVKLSPQQVQSTLQTVVDNLHKSVQEITTAAAQATKLTTQQISQTTASSLASLNYASVIRIVAKETGNNIDHIASIVSTLANVIQSDRREPQTATIAASVLQGVATRSNAPTLSVSLGLAPDKTQSVLTALASHLSKNETKVIESVSKETGISTEKINAMIQTIEKQFKELRTTMQVIAQQTKSKPEEVEKTLAAQAAILGAPQKHIDAMIPVPDSVSLEDYEEVKKMWVAQYEKGEVPVSENITDRDAWVDNDVVFITNTLNKLMSTDEKLKQEALDELGYILPVFMINNFSGEELLVYLKAKLEAAKEIQSKMSAVQSATQSRQASQEFVDVTSHKQPPVVYEEQIASEIPPPSQTSAQTVTTTTGEAVNKFVSVAKIETTQDSKQKEEVTHKLSEEEQVQKKKELQQTLPAPMPVSQAISLLTRVPKEQVTTITSTLLKTRSADNDLLSSLSKDTKLTVQQVQTALNALANNIDKSVSEIDMTVAKETQLTTSHISQIANQALAPLSLVSLIQRVTSQTGASKETVASTLTAVTDKLRSESKDTQTSQVLATIFKETATSPLVATVASDIGLSVPQTTQLLTSLGAHATEPGSLLIENVAKETSVSSDTILKLTHAIEKEFKDLRNTLTAISQQTKSKPEEVEKTLAAQAAILGAPQKHIDAMIPVPDSVSLEDYEEVKKMWVAQYEKGEVPVSENITDRDAWVDNDVVFITNTLNKLMSTDEKLKQEALDELGYILPVFMINNFSGEELLVYLKAKLEAAKEIQSKMSAVQSATQSRQASQEFVDVTSHKQPPVVYEEQTAQAIPQRSQVDGTLPANKLLAVTKIEAIRDVKHMQEAAKTLTKVEQVEKKEELQRTLPPQPSIIQAIATMAQIPKQEVTAIINSFTATFSNDAFMLDRLAKSTNLSTQQVTSILQTLPGSLNQPFTRVDSQVAHLIHETFVPMSLTTIVQETSKQTSENKERVETTLASLSSLITSSEKDEKTANILSTLLRSTATSTLAPVLAQTVSLPTQEVNRALTSLAAHAKESGNGILQTVSKETSIPQEKIGAILQTIEKEFKALTASLQTVMKDVQTTPENLEKTLAAQAAILGAPQKHIDAMIPVPDSVSLEDYEEVKKMWVAQYEKGEVPVSENITDRDAWVDNDVVFITNTLNKLMSTDEKLKQEALDELGYILPVFMINNFSGEELLVYLKAKLEAAKEIQSKMSAVQSATQSRQASQEFVDVTSHKQPPVVYEEQISSHVSATNTSTQKVQVLKEIVTREVQRNLSASISPQELEQKKTQVLASLTALPPQTSIDLATIGHSLVAAIESNAGALERIAKETKTNKEQIKTLLQTLTLKHDTATPVGLNSSQVQTAVKEVFNSVDIKEATIKDVVKKDKVSPDKAKRQFDEARKQLLAQIGQGRIEETVPLPEEFSIDDFEEIKKMWKLQYERGEVPVTDQIKTRLDWINSDIIFISDTLEKLLSPDERLKNEGLNALGYILPVFMINNLSGQEILVYLKAKLEAAREVKELLERQNDVVDRLQKQIPEVEVAVRAEGIGKREKEQAKSKNLD